MKTYELHLPENYTPLPLPGRDKWLAALRSGEYEQGRERLCSYGKYCCLGVLSKIQGRLTQIGADVGSDSLKSLSLDNPAADSIGALGYFPDNVWVMLMAGNTSLAECNDNGLTFLQIADIIEKVWAEG